MTEKTLMNNKLPQLLSAIIIAITLVGCGSTKQASDPFEGFNRKMHSFNMKLDEVILEPVAKTYKKATPQFVQTGVSNFFDNITYPGVIINQLLQGNVQLCLEDTGRFIINSTFGIGGLLDPATPTGLPKHDEDFGQTFAVWGFNSGPYIVAPIFGPLTVRDGFGKFADSFTNPIYYIDDKTTKYSFVAASVIDTRTRLLDKQDMISGDEYLFIRDAYLQRRAFLIKNGKADDSDPFLDE